MNKEHIKKVFSDEEFVKSLIEMETPEEIQTALKEKGVDFTLEEVMQLGEQISRAAELSGEGGELSLDQLDDVAGGFLIVGAVAFVVVGLIVGTGLKFRW